MPTDPTHQQPSEQNNTTLGSNNKQSLALALALALALVLAIVRVLLLLLVLAPTVLPGDRCELFFDRYGSKKV
jgi:hypothetical protein